MQNARAIPTAHIRAEGDGDALIQQFPDGTDPASDVGVADGAVRDTRAAFSYQGAFEWGEVYPMSEHGQGGEEPVVIVDGGVGVMFGEELPDKGEFGLALGDVRLDGEFGFLVQIAERG